MTTQNLAEILARSGLMLEFNNGVKSFTNNEITIDKKLSALADYLYPQSDFDLEYNERKGNAPDWKKALQLFITTYECKDGKKPVTNIEQGFQYGISGENPYLYQLKDAFIYFSKTFNFVKNFNQFSHYLDLSKGYRMGLNYYKLIQELGSLQENTNTKKMEEENNNHNKKLLLKCSPAQFATIVEMLMDKDYIVRSNNAEGTAKILLKAFEFKDYPTTTFESLGKRLFKETPAINVEDYNSIKNGTFPLRKYLKSGKE